MKTMFLAMMALVIGLSFGLATFAQADEKKPTATAEEKKATTTAEEKKKDETAKKGGEEKKSEKK